MINNEFQFNSSKKGCHVCPLSLCFKGKWTIFNQTRSSALLDVLVFLKHQMRPQALNECIKQTVITPYQGDLRQIYLTLISKTTQPTR